MNNKTTLFKPMLYTLLTVCIAVVALTATQSRELFFASASIVALGGLVVLGQLRYVRREVDGFLKFMGEAVSHAQTNSAIHLPMPVLVVGEEGEVVWYNQRAAALFTPAEDLYGHPIGKIFEGVDYREPCPEHGVDVTLDGHRYSLFYSQSPGEALHTLYLMDDNDLKKNAELYFKTKATVMIISIDNYDELAQSSRESDRAQILSETEYQITQFIEKHGGIVDKVEKDLFVAYLEEQHLQDVLKTRFDLLDTVRAVAAGDRVPTTLSIGVGRGAKSLRESEQLARQALDMALGRGGDQAAVRTENGYDFYGGLSKGVEKRTKVKTRIVATALMELIESSGNVIIMGHCYGDLDSFGAAVALLRAVRQMGKTAHIAIDRHRHLVSPLFERLEQNGYEDAFVHPAELMETVDQKTLLIVVDTHTEAILESGDLYRKCKTVVVIDHHRKMVGHIDNAVIFYHEPYASSASEMVTELVQYFGEQVKLGRQEGEALLAGIMLDTKNFIVKTGVRTFEAAAYLRRLGADTVEVRKLFNSSMETYQHRSRLVASAELYKGCAVCGTNTHIEEIKVVAPQAADELLGISGVEASFVLYEYEGGVSMSARSLGDLNVQVIMEKLGGGGHMTMAGAQLADTNLEDARQKLLEAIDSYREENA